MPKIVDHEDRRRQIARAIVARIEREGIATVSVRAIAADLGSSPSALRHYFPSSDEMLDVTLRMMRDHQQQRLQSARAAGSPAAQIRATWLQALPLDAERRREAQVWLAVMTTARTPALRATLEEMNAGLDHLCRATVAELAPHSSAAVEALHLRAFTDGLTVGALTAADRFTPQRLEQSLDDYLAALRERGAQGRHAGRERRDEGDESLHVLDLDGRRFEITRARAADVRDLVGLLADDVLGRERESRDLAVYESAFAAIDRDPNQLLIAVRDAAGKIVATMQLSLIPSLSRGGASRLQIEAVRVAASTRGTGLGTALFEWAHAWGREHDARLAQLTTDVTRQEAQRFYERLGYAPSHVGFKLPL
jgi:AcrR family transcriptional regulator/ribosomal protein S18 acetylase RimI-like enzyme